jgi:hypothetical protein
MTKGYCLIGDVGDFLGQSFTAPQAAYCVQLIARAEAYIDFFTNRGWLVGAQTAEAHQITHSPLVYLRYAPVATVTAVRGRGAVGDAEIDMVADSDYEIRSLENGLIVLLATAYSQFRLRRDGQFSRIRVDYAPVAAVPAPITQATIELVALWMQPRLRPDSYGIDSYTLPDLTVRFSRSHVQEALPPTVQQILTQYRYPVIA